MVKRDVSYPAQNPVSKNIHQLQAVCWQGAAGAEEKRSISQAEKQLIVDPALEFQSGGLPLHPKCLRAIV